MSFDTSTLIASAMFNQKAGVNASRDAQVLVRGGIDVPSFGLVAVAADSGSAFLTDTAVLQELGNGRYAVALRPNAALDPGTYSGTLTIRLCADASCSRGAAAAGTTSYELTILPGFQAEVYVGGRKSWVLESNFIKEVAVPSGGLIEIHSNIPVSVRPDARPLPGITLEVDPASTDRVWRAVVRTTMSEETQVLVMPSSPEDNLFGAILKIRISR